MMAETVDALVPDCSWKCGGLLWAGDGQTSIS